MSQPSQVFRYRRIDDGSRSGDWWPLDKAWQTAASPGLIAHDIYHHLPTDTGTFADEVAALGADWYVCLQPQPGAAAHQRDSALAKIWRYTEQITLNALDSAEERPFALVRRQGCALSPLDAAAFREMGERAARLLGNSDERRAADRSGFVDRFVQVTSWGYQQARIRFPDQTRTRRACSALARELADLDVSEVPFGHDIAIHLRGQECTVTYADADAAFMREHQVDRGLAMPWFIGASNDPIMVSVHASELAFVDYAESVLRAQEAQGLDEARCQLPGDSARGLISVLVRSNALRAQLATAGSLQVSTGEWNGCDLTPRGFRVL